jgi:hypothetical protein
MGTRHRRHVPARPSGTRFDEHRWDAAGGVAVKRWIYEGSGEPHGTNTIALVGCYLSPGEVHAHAMLYMS